MADPARSSAVSVVASGATAVGGDVGNTGAAVATVANGVTVAGGGAVGGAVGGAGAGAVGGDVGVVAVWAKKEDSNLLGPPCSATSFSCADRSDGFADVTWSHTWYSPAELPN